LTDRKGKDKSTNSNLNRPLLNNKSIAPHNIIIELILKFLFTNEVIKLKKVAIKKILNKVDGIGINLII